MNNFLKSLKNYLSTDNQRIFLQRTYLILSIISFALSSAVSIFDNEIGRSVLMFSVIFMAIFLVNAIILTLSKAFFEFYFGVEIAKKEASKSKK